MVSGAPPSLAQLRPPHPPAEIGWWPPAPGWWVLALLLLGLVVVLAVAAWRHQRRNRYRGLARAELEARYRAYQAHGDPARYLQEVSALLRRTALAAYPREQVAGLRGKAWIAFLARSGRLPGFIDGPGAILAEGPYQPKPTLKVESLQGLARQWLKRHRGPGAAPC